MDTTESSAPHAHPSTEDHDETLEAHYACLERPCACIDGWVFVGYVDEDGEEAIECLPCRRCREGGSIIRHTPQKRRTHDTKVAY